ncbi:VOC family protein [Butyrivibrio sp. NC3005]|uniref:VOC family protein n=1 Tax=Butyrivibrio sp. NC3005 TaxID=1280685 RepID=UPI0003F4F1BE|nr:VOC family protein [Butyrivibrio sp. NC3005]
MKISHLIYKVDNLKKAVESFENYGFCVEYGKREHPYNALIYFNDHTYIELIQNQNITPFLIFLLKLFGMRDYLESSLEQEKHEEGFMRFAIHMDIDEKKSIQDLYKKYFGAKTIFVPIKRKDIHGNILKCKCLMPSNAALPFFNTEFNNDSLWNVKHKNKVTGIERIVYSASESELSFFDNKKIDDRVVLLNGGKGIIEVEFSYEQESSNTISFMDGCWQIEDNRLTERMEG